MSKHNSKKAFTSMLWRFGERISAQLVSFVVSIVLARILLPAEFGIVAMTTIFITICNVLVTSGPGLALIQKERADDLDFSTLFIFGTALSLVIYLILYVCSPMAADFYHEPALTDVLRVMAIRLPLAAISSVQLAYVARQMLFRKFFWSTLIGTIISAIVGILMAYAGCGVWALVAQNLVNAIMDTIILGVTVRWFPGLRFSMQRLRAVFGFSWRILCSDLIGTIYNELRGLIIGKHYSAEQLALYDRGFQVPHIFVTNVGVALSSVMLPVMAQEQNDEKRLRDITKRTITVGTYLMFPVMAGFGIVAEPMTRFLLTEKWLPAVPYLQMACFIYSLDPWATANLQALKARGKAKEYLRLEIRKKTVAILILLASLPFGVYVLAGSGCLYAFISVIMEARKNTDNIQYGFGSQMKDILPNIVITLLMGIPVYLMSFLPFRSEYVLFLQIAAGVFLYVFLSAFTHNENYVYIKRFLKALLKSRTEYAL